jgi:hypothetical protein
MLSAMTVFQLLVIDPPIWLINAIDKLRRGFLWDNDEIASGGKCLVCWSSICRPSDFDGLGISDIQPKGIALRMRWIWLRWQEGQMPWQNLPVHVDDKTRALFHAAVKF